MPSSTVYDTISYAILTKNSSYSSTAISHRTFNQESPITEVLLTHIWRNHVKYPFYMLLSIQILFYICYTVAISFPEEIFGYTPGSPIRHPGHLVCLAVAFVMWILCLFQEVRQMMALKWEYWRSLYNYIDLFAAIFPLITFCLLVTDSSQLVSVYKTMRG